MDIFWTWFSTARVMNKARFYKAFNSISGQIGRNASEEVLFTLIKSKCLPILLYGIEACPTNSADLQSLQSTMNRLLFKIFGAMSKEMSWDISKYFGVYLLKKIISARWDKFLKRHRTSDNLYRLIYDRSYTDFFAYVILCFCFILFNYF